MALFKILKGNEAALPSTKTEGYVYVTEDTHKMYIDKSSTERFCLNADKADKINYAICSTAASTAEKSVTATGFTLATGSIITIYFTVTNSASNPTLNVNLTGAKPIKYKGAAISKSYLKANYAYTFIYDGTDYILIGEINIDTKVSQNVSTASSTYPILLTYSANATSNTTNTTKFSKGVKVQPSTNTIIADTFQGDLTGNANTATSATNDSDGNAIVDTYMTITNPTGEGYFTLGARDDQYEFGTTSMAAGEDTVASGLCSQAFGYGSQALHDCAYAEGDCTVASGEGSHAEGFYSEASGNYSHAEGYETTASGDYSHSEGNYTIASGKSSHAEGYKTMSFGMYAHSEGCGERVCKVWSVQATVTAYGYKMIIDDPSAIEVGDKLIYSTQPYTINKVEVGTTNYIYTTTKPSISITSKPTNSNCFIQKQNPGAQGNYSHVEGYFSHATQTASHAEGFNTLAQGAYAHAEGTSTIANGTAAHVEGYATEARANYTHAEGYNTIASGMYAHAEGNGTTASKDASHAEGYETTASGTHAHAEGYKTTASGTHAHAEGGETTASSSNAHAEGYNTTASGSSSHTEGSGTIASGSNSHAEGYNTTTIGSGSHAEGSNYTSTGTTYYSDREVKIGDEILATILGSTAAGVSSHAEGVQTYAGGYGSHAEGIYTITNNQYAHAEGSTTIASGEASHAEGYMTTASGMRSHAEGSRTIASGEASHAGGHYTTALKNQYVIGHYNMQKAATTTMSGTSATAFIIGNGTSSSQSNAFMVEYSGNVGAGGTFGTIGQDYAEYFEWEDFNQSNEDRRGYFVSLYGEKIKIAEPNDYILGIVSSQPSILGNNDMDWRGRYILDEFGAYIPEEFEYEEEVINDITGEKQTIIKIGTKFKENPEYDPNLPYTPRKDRPEWSPVGMMGVLSVRDDGTCTVNGFCKVAEGGIATASETGYRVIKRVNNHIVKIIFK